MNMLYRYGQWLRVCRTLSGWTVLLAGMAALSEGLALGSLAPLLNVMTGQKQSGVEYIWNILDWHPEGQTLLVVCLLVFVVLVTVAAGTRSLSQVLALAVQTRVEAAMRERMTDALLAMEWVAFVKLRQGDISKAMVLEGMQVGTGGMYIVLAAGATFAAIGYLVISFVISYKLSLIALTFGISGGGFYLLASRGVRRYADRLSHLASDIGDRSAELFGNLKYFRATGQEGELRNRAASLFNTYGKVFLKSQMFSPILRGGIELIAAFFVAGFLFYQLGVRHGSIAEILIFLAIFYRMVPRVLNIQSYLFQARTYLTWLDTYDARINAARAAVQPKGGDTIPVFEHLVRFKDVSLIFPGQNRPALQGINLELFKGQCIALVGPSGGGKTTLTDMLLGLVRPTSGSIEVDGLGLNLLDQEAWRSHIGLVMQEPLMLHASVAINVAMRTNDIDIARVENALHAADAWDFVRQLPDGIDTIIAERGARLSGGQRQRIAIARALYRQPEILILDEATSALDSSSEERVQLMLDKMLQNMTTVIVAHRLKTIKNADQIYVLAEGQIQERGTWEELMKAKGMLYGMASQQHMSTSLANHVDS